MTPQQRQRVEELYDQLAEAPAERVAEVLAETSGDDPEVCRQVRRLLSARSAPTAEAASARTGLRTAFEQLVGQPECDPLVGKSVGPYRILERLGAGGMGSVYKAEQRIPVRRTVALKIIKAGFDTAEVIARFNAERQAMARMDHPCIAKVLDAGTTDAARPYFVMEYVAGTPVTQFADDNRLSIRQRLLLFVDVCSAIAHAHSKAVIHRDIKSSNVLAYRHDGKPMVKVIDFGIAKALTSDRLTDLTFNTMQGNIIGTYESMSPEQAAGSPDIDTRSDVYSLGVLLYELLAGMKPLDRRTLAGAAEEEIRRIIREVDPPRPSTRLTGMAEQTAQIAAARQAEVDSLARQLRSELEWIPLKAMRKEPDRRYNSPLQLAEDIQNYLHNRPLIAGPESGVYRMRKFVLRNKGGVVAVASFLIAFPAGFVAMSLSRADALRARQAEARQRAIAVAEAEKQKAANQFLNRLLASANPRWQSASDAQSGRDVTVLEIVQKGARELDAGVLRDQPAVEASLRITIGGTLLDLGDLAGAEAQLRAALRVNQQAFGNESMDVLICLRGLGNILERQGKLGEAEQFSREALELSRKLLTPPNDSIADCLHTFGAVLEAQGKLDQAERHYRDALAMRRALGEATLSGQARDLNDLAGLLQARGNYEQAEPLFREALEINRKLLGEDHVDLAINLNNVGMTLVGRGELAQAEPLIQRALEIFRKQVGDTSLEVATTLRNQARIYRSLGKLAEAEAAAAESLAIRRALLGNEHPLVGEALFTSAVLLHDQKKWAEAEAMYRQALSVRRVALGPSAGPTTRTAAALGEVLQQLGRQQEADTIRGEYGLMAPSTHPAARP
jgi:serine/threonine protein kinase/Tfp pilus assembly protein PilF